jgi:hypothetical protein
MRALLLLLLLAFGGCAAVPREDSPVSLLSHDVSVPRRYRAGDAWPGFDGDAKRYVSFYEAGWWDCVAQLAKDIDYRPTVSDRAANGWPCEVDGCWDGYTAAEVRVATLIRRYGKKKARDILEASLSAPPMKKEANQPPEPTRPFGPSGSS